MAPLYIRDITNSAYICNTLQFSKTDILYSWCDTTVCDREMLVRKCVKEPVNRRGCFTGIALVLEGVPVQGHLSEVICLDTLLFSV